jgi:hypothetical protein
MSESLVVVVYYIHISTKALSTNFFFCGWPLVVAVVAATWLLELVTIISFYFYFLGELLELFSPMM